MVTLEISSYLDESGEYVNWAENNNFVLAGVAIHEGQISTLTKALDQIQYEFFPGIKAPIPFHAVEIAKGKKKFRELPPPKQKDLLYKLCELIKNQSFPYLIAFATPFHISAYQPSNSVLKTVYGDIMTRLNTFMVRQHKAGYPTKGIVIIDQAHERKYRELFQG